jgi:hypothetical protein
MKQIISVLFLLVMGSVSLAQNEVDALRYSQNNVIGTARSAGMAGAFGALGADFSSLSINPAGLGVYRTSEFVFTPQLSFSSIDATYNGMTKNDEADNFSLANIGMVLAQELPNRLNKDGWRFIQFGFGINRLNNFNYRSNIEGVNTQNTMGDYYANVANGLGYPYSVIEDDEYDEFAYLNPAWWTYAIGEYSDTSLYYSGSANTPYHQKQSSHTWGSMNEVAFSFGANYNDKLFVGASLGFPYIRYFQERSYTETNTAPGIDSVNYRSFSVSDRLETKGTGVNMKFGLIFKPINWLRIGGAIHTPTWYSNMTDELYVDMHTNFDTPDNSGDRDYYASFPYLSDTKIYEYDLRTPFKAFGNFAVFIKKYGLFSFDYEYIDYGSAKLRSVDYDYDYENDAIANKYVATHNFKIGTEWRYANFAFRGGYAIYASPYADKINDGERTIYSLGLGYRVKSFFIDFAYVHTETNEDYYLYGNDIVQVNATQMDYTKNRFLMTLGFKFE